MDWQARTGDTMLVKRVERWQAGARRRKTKYIRPVGWAHSWTTTNHIFLLFSDTLCCVQGQRTAGRQAG
jgi:hypothetical protein